MLLLVSEDHEIILFLSSGWNNVISALMIGIELFPKSGTWFFYFWQYQSTWPDFVFKFLTGLEAYSKIGHHFTPMTII